MFNQDANLALDSILHATSLFLPGLGPEQQTTIISGSIKRFRVSFRSQLLRLAQLGTPEPFTRWFKRVRVVEMIKGEKDKQTKYLQYGGIIEELDFDVGKWKWSPGLGKLHSYTAKLGCTTIVHSRSFLEKPIGSKRHGALPISFQPKWQEVWLPYRPQKEAAFLWSVYHCAIAVNCWHAQVALHISILCIICPNHELELVVHRMALCPRAQTIWNYALTILYTALAIAPSEGSWPALVWQQCVVGSKLPRRLQKGKELWSLI